MWWIIVLAVLVGLAFFPLGIIVIQDEKGPHFFATLWFIRIPIYSTAEGRRKIAQLTQEVKTQAKTIAGEVISGEKDRSIVKDFLVFLRSCLLFVLELKNKMVIRRLEVKVVLADDYPAELALSYGKGWALLGNLMPFVERFFRIRKRNLEVECDFTAKQTRVYARAFFTITLSKAIVLICTQGVQFAKDYMKFMNN